MTSLPLTIFLRCEMQRENLLEIINSIEMDPASPVQVTIKKTTNKRTLDQNSLYWKYVTSIAEQIKPNNIEYSRDVWNDYLKREFLPFDENEKETCPGYVKFSPSPSGESILVGSTTHLTTFGMQTYLDQVIRFAAENNIVLEDI